VQDAKAANPQANRALMAAARDGNIEAVKQHLAAGTDVNVKEKHGMTPLHFAA
jgi:ankyrin repeat protein